MSAFKDSLSREALGGDTGRIYSGPYSTAGSCAASPRERCVQCRRRIDKDERQPNGMCLECDDAREGAAEGTRSVTALYGAWEVRGMVNPGSHDGDEVVDEVECRQIGYAGDMGWRSPIEFDIKAEARLSMEHALVVQMRKAQERWAS